MEAIDLLVEDVLSKRELSNLDKDFVRQKVSAFLDQNPKVSSKLASSDYPRFKRSKEHDIAIKAVRSELRRLYGVFIAKGYERKAELLSQAKALDDDHVMKILSLHRSSSERLPIYAMAYESIFAITGKPSSILDLACGLNPLSYGLLGCSPRYVACDISDQDLSFVKLFFDKFSIDGEVARVDLLRDDVSGISSVDVAFLFKALDSLEEVRRGSSRKVLLDLKSRHVVVSFATRSIGGRKGISAARRSWLERFFAQQGWGYSRFELPGELFYVATR